MMLWTYISSWSLSETTKESWQGYLTTSSPWFTRWSSNKIHLACPKKRCKNFLTLHIGMPHPIIPSSGCLAEISLCMRYWCDQILINDLSDRSNFEMFERVSNLSDRIDLVFLIPALWTIQKTDTLWRSYRNLKSPINCNFWTFNQG